jgi:hypothetical protein
MSQPSINIRAMDVEDSLYTDVPALSVQAQSVVIPDGVKWEIRLFVGNAAYLDDIHVRLVWDYGGAGEEIIVATHGDMEFQLVRVLQGDGVKKLAIVLDNATLADRVVGAAWYGVLKA